MLNKVRKALADWGWLLAVVSILLTAGVIYTRPDVPIVGTPPATVEKKVLPTTGEQGYDVLAFCKEADKVVGPKVSPPDSTYAATFSLYRMKDGVQEQIDIGTYTNAEEQPNGTHYDSGNNPTPAFVTKEAMACIISKAVPPTR